MALPSPTVAPKITKGGIRQGASRMVWVPTIANISSPTLAELSAGTDYSWQIAGLDGFSPSASTVDFPNLATRIIGNVPGTVTLGEGTVMFNLSLDTSVADARTVFNDGTDGTTPTSGYWADFVTGNVTGGKMNVYAASTTSATVSTALTDILMLTVVFALQAVAKNVAIPAA